MGGDLATKPWRRGLVLTDPRPRSIRDALHEVAGAVPDHLAVDDGNRAVSYAELVADTERVAAAVRAHPADSASPVMVVVEQGTEAILTIIGVAASGRIGATVDSRDPVERLREIHREAGASLIVCDRASVDVARAISADTPLITPDDLPMTVVAATYDLDPASPATLSFTSGSTGTPKGLLRDHNSAVHGAFRYAYVEQLTPDDRYGLAGSVGFPAFQWFVWGALLNGISLCFYDLRSRGAAEIPDWVNANGVTLIWFVPSVLRAVVHAAPDAFMPSVRSVGTGGEALLGSDVRHARPLFAPRTVFENWFASSEALTVCHRIVTPDDEASDDVVPIGPPQPWVDVRIVDDFDNDVPDGDPGTVMVIGEAFSLGYWRDPGRTAECFFDLPDGRRGCRTSDRARRRPDGVLEHLGRSDDRVKVRGAMVSPSEVERALTALPDVAAAVISTPDARTGGTRLVGYAVTEGQASPSGWQLRRELAAHVPSHMVPGTIVILPAMPVGNRGKVDRAALPPPLDLRSRYREPVGRERELANVFGEVLDVDKVGLDDDFFDLGGDSLAAIELLAAIDQHFGVSVTTSVLLESPTVAGLARRLVRHRERSASTVVALRAQGTGTPLFCIAGGGSPATSLRALADTLAPRPVYGIQARGLEERAWPDRSVEACARRYLGELRSLQATGPYLLAGHSFGGLVAFEMACRLEADGEKVARLSIVDAIAPGAALSVPEASVPLRSTVPGSSVGAAFQRVGRSVVGQAQYRLELATAGIVRRRLRQYRVFYLLSKHIGARYQPKRRFHGAALVVRSTADSDLPSLSDADLGWSQWLGGPVDVVDVASDHVGMMRQPHVREVGDHLERAVRGSNDQPNR
jgi:acyl-coenzyme A synthetase/AMP-(fatty) acid ligase/thioesterase domain-containing protein/acyl carrier protein